MGIITAVWAGLFAALLGGSKYNVAGPTGALSGILASFALINGVGALPMLAILSGLMILAVYAIRLERYIVLIPASVLHGFTLGVALIIGFGQINAALGITRLGVINPAALAVSVAGFAFLYAAGKWLPKIPAITTVSAAGIGLGAMSAHGCLSFHLPTILTKYGSIGYGLAAVPRFSISAINANLLVTASTVTVIAILETLISGKIADGMTHSRFDQRREILGLGVGNIASGLFGGLPATAALARTSLNIKKGATSNMSGIISSVLVGAISLVLLPYFQYLPLCVVASILMYVAFNMVEAEHFKKLFRVSKRSFGLALIVAVLTVTWEPLFAIGVGTAIALLVFVDSLSQANVEVSINDTNSNLVSRVHSSELPELEYEDRTIVYRFAGELIYINAQSHMTTLEQINGDTRAVVFSLRNLYFIDMDGSDMLAEIIDDLQSKKILVYITGINTMIQPMIKKTDYYRALLNQGKVLPSTQAALAALKQ